METRGFVRKLYKLSIEPQRQTLAEAGVKIIYEIGKGAEDLDNCIMAFRGRGGIIKHAADLRIFGDTQAEIAEAVGKCEEANVRIIDLANPELKTIAAQLKHAFARIAFMRRWDGDKRKARRTGAAGGHAKAEHQARKRAEKIPDDAVRKLIAMIGRKLTWRDVADITGISTATLRRHYKG